MLRVSARSRIAKLVLLIVLGVGGYAAFQLAPAWLQFCFREFDRSAAPAGGRAVCRRALDCLSAGACGIDRGHDRARLFAGAGACIAPSERLAACLRARLLLLCGSILLSLTGLEAGAAAWRWRLHQSPELPRAKPSSAGFGQRRLGRSAKTVAIRSLPSKFVGSTSRLYRHSPADANPGHRRVERAG